MGWLLAAATAAILFLSVRIFLLKKSAKEISEAFAEKLKTDTNTVIGISSRDKDMRRLADSINIQLKELRKEHLLYHRKRPSREPRSSQNPSWRWYWFNRRSIFRWMLMTVILKKWRISCRLWKKSMWSSSMLRITAIFGLKLKKRLVYSQASVTK